MSLNRATVASPPAALGYATHPAEQLVSDAEREYTVDLLRAHWVAGRLTETEFEERVAEAWGARVSSDLWQALRALPMPTPPAGARPESGSGNAVAALVLGIAAICLLIVSFGLLFPLTLPLSAMAWALGRSARRASTRGGGRSGAAAAGEALGVVGTVLGTVLLAGCAAVVTVVV
jgi:Domain of unknown function (DUF1707)